MQEYFFDPALRKCIESILLPDVQLPGQYIGGEIGQVVKRSDSVRGRLVLAFPDAYSIGMSNYAFALLYSLMNARSDWSCERAYTPFPDMEQKLRENGLPLYSLETFAPLWSFDVVGITLQHELCASNVLTTLDLGKIPLHFSERRATDPLVIAGGPSAFNPEPMSRFFDLFVVGDGEESLPAVCDFWLELKQKYGVPSVRSSNRGEKPADWETPDADTSQAMRREMLLETARKFPWAYVPMFYEAKTGTNGRMMRPRPTESGVPETIHPAIVQNLDNYPPPKFPLVPLVEAVQDRISVEIMRGCPQKCRFCQSSPIKRPLRFRSVDQIIDSAKTACKKTGISDVTLLSLSSSEYPKFDQLLSDFSAKVACDGVTVSVPSLRVNHQLSDVVSALSTEKSSSLTLAPEAALDSMRRRIAKRVTTEDLLNGCRAAFENGFFRIKLYFMCGFPGETEADIDGIIDLCEQIARLGKDVRGRWPTVVANVSNFVPKPQTPLQWAPMASEETFRAAHHRLRDRLHLRSVSLKYHFLPTSLLEGLLTRGDRRVGEIIESAWRKGARFCSWKDHFDPKIWEEAVSESSLDVNAVVHTEYSTEDELPWDHIAVWAGREKLLKEYQYFLHPETDPTPPVVPIPRKLRS